MSNIKPPHDTARCQGVRCNAMLGLVNEGNSDDNTE